MKFKRLTETATLPTRAYDSYGYDLYADEDVIIHPHECKKVKTGISCAIPAGYVGQIWDRSSVGSKNITKTCGVIDADYRGEIIICLSNNNSDFHLTFNDYTYLVKKGDKIAQMLVVPCLDEPVEEAKELPETSRGDKGFGSSN